MITLKDFMGYNHIKALLQEETRKNDGYFTKIKLHCPPARFKQLQNFFYKYFGRELILELTSNNLIFREIIYAICQKGIETEKRQDMIQRLKEISSSVSYKVLSQAEKPYYVLYTIMDGYYSEEYLKIRDDKKSELDINYLQFLLFETSPEFRTILKKGTNKTFKRLTNTINTLRANRSLSASSIFIPPSELLNNLDSSNYLK